MAVAFSGCMLDSALARREGTTTRLRAEARLMRGHLGRLESRRARLDELVRTGTAIGGASRLLDELRTSGFDVGAGRGANPRGILRLSLREAPFDPDGRPDPRAVSRLARAATLLRETLPDHEISVEAGSLARAVAVVRALHEGARVPGSRLRAATGGPRGVSGTSAAVTLEVRPTRIEALVELKRALAASDW